MASKKPAQIEVVQIDSVVSVIFFRFLTFTIVKKYFYKLIPN